MLTIHHLGVSQSDRIVWLCEELEIPYKMIRYQRDPVSQLAPPEYKALHPSGTSPVIQDGDLTLAESGAIIQYVIHRHGSGRLAVRPDQPNFPDYLFWFHYANSSMMPAALLHIVRHFTSAAGNEGPDNPTLNSLEARWHLAFDAVERRLAEAPFLAGKEFTAADIIMEFPLTTMRLWAPHDISGCPNLLDYLQRISRRPAFERAFRKCDPDMPLNLK